MWERGGMITRTLAPARWLESFPPRRRGGGGVALHARLPRRIHTYFDHGIFLFGELDTLIGSEIPQVR